ncbi:MAG: D-alanine--D-alanine ligase [Pseudomonadota bacterium]
MFGSGVVTGVETSWDDARVAVVCGGCGPEAGVSRISGGSVAAALRTRLDHVAVMEFDDGLAARVARFAPTCVFPIVHGVPGEDGTLQGFLDTIGLPYVGSGVLASACAMHKGVATTLLRAAGLPVSPSVTVARADGKDAGALHVAETIGCDVVLKPIAGGSGLGVRFARNLDEVRAALGDALDACDQVIVEQRARGAEVTVAVLERDGCEALPPVAIETPPGSWYDYRHRYTHGLSRHVVPAPIGSEKRLKLQQLAVTAHRTLGCRDLSRADFIVPTHGRPVLLEVNTLPGMTPTSLYPDAAAAIGLSFEDLVCGLVRRALRRPALARGKVLYHMAGQRMAGPGPRGDRTAAG